MTDKNFTEEDLKLIGEDSNSWTQAIRRGYTLSFLLYTFHDLGVFEELKEGPKSSRELSEKLKLNEKLLRGGLNFFVHSDTSLVKEGDKYRLTKQGEERIFSDKTIAMALGAVGAYHILFTNYSDALKGKKRYGVDFERDGRLISKASYLTGKANYEWVVSKLKDLKVQTVVDLGCGSGNILIDFCKKNDSLNGIGVDISQGAIDEAKERIERSGLSNRISLVLGDIINPESYSGKIENKGSTLAFNSVMVLHEFLYKGEDAVVDILKKMKKEFPGSYFLLGEFNKISDEEFNQMSLPEKMHMLFYQEIIHKFTPQDLANKETWLRIFNKANVEVLEVKDDLPFRLVEYVLKF